MSNTDKTINKLEEADWGLALQMDRECPEINDAIYKTDERKYFIAQCSTMHGAPNLRNIA